jgi:hypothetical protein
MGSNSHPSSLEEARQFVEEIKRDEIKVIENDHSRTKDRIENYFRDVKRDLDDPALVIPELLQNAEDTEVSDRVEIEFTEEELRVRNIGRPMSYDEVNAICSIGDSTKRDPDHIGHFGRGFKSVFSITKKPRIKTGYFRFEFSFDRPTVPEPLENMDDNKIEGTEIILPIKENISEERLSQLKQRLEFVPEVLVNLENIREISVSTPESEELYRREEEGDATLRILCNGDTLHRLKRFETSHQLPEKYLGQLIDHRDIELEDAGDVEAKVSISFPVSEDGYPDTEDKTGRLYNFLPTEVEVDLPFDVQADFLLGSDRKKLHKPEGKYNQWLYSKVADTLQETLEHYRNESQNPNAYFEILPIEESRLTKSATPAPEREIRERTRSMVPEQECIPDINENYRAPNEVVNINNRLRAALPQEELQDILQDRIYYPNDDIEESTLETLEEVGMMKEVSVEDIAEGSTSEILSGKNKEYLLLFSAGLTELWEKCNGTDFYSGLSSSKERLPRGCRGLPIIPLKNGRVAAFDDIDGRLFVPDESMMLDDWPSIREKLVLIDLEDPEGVDIDDFPGDFDEDSTKDIIRDARSFFVHGLDVDVLSETTILAEVIQPAFNDEVDDDDADEMLVYLFSKQSLWEEAGERDVIRLMSRSTDTGEQTPDYMKPSDLYMTEEYGLKYDPEAVLSGLDSVNFIHSRYMEVLESQSENRGFIADTDKIREFLSELGVRDIPRISGYEQNRDKSRVKETVEENLEETAIGDIEIPDGVKIHTGSTYDTWLKSYKYAVEDVEPGGALSELLEEAEDRFADDLDRYTEFAKLLDLHWDKYGNCMWKRLCYTVHEGGSYTAGEKEVKSLTTFGQMLRNSSWYPTKADVLAPPSTLFIENAYTKGREEREYIGYEPDSDFLDDLGVKERLDVENVVDRLSRAEKLWGNEDPSDIYRRLKGTLNRIQQELEENNLADESLDDLRDTAFIYLEGEDPEFRSIDEVVWRGDKRLGNYAMGVKDEYGEYQELFEELGIRERVDIEISLDYIHELDPDEDREDIYSTWRWVVQLLSREFKELGADELEEVEAINRLRSEKIVPVVGEDLNRLSDIEYYCSDPEILDNMSDGSLMASTVEMISVENPDESLRSDLWESIGLKNLADVVNRLERYDENTPEHDSMKNKRDLKNLLNIAYSYLDKKDRVESAKRLISLSEYSVHKTKNLQAYYELEGSEITEHFSVDAVINDEDGRVLYEESEPPQYSISKRIPYKFGGGEVETGGMRKMMTGCVGKPQEMLEKYLEDNGFDYRDITEEEIRAEYMQEDEPEGAEKREESKQNHDSEIKDSDEESEEDQESVNNTKGGGPDTTPDQHSESEPEGASEEGAEDEGETNIAEEQPEGKTVEPEYAEADEAYGESESNKRENVGDTDVGTDVGDDKSHKAGRKSGQGNLRGDGIENTPSEVDLVSKRSEKKNGTILTERGSDKSEAKEDESKGGGNSGSRSANRRRNRSRGSDIDRQDVGRWGEKALLQKLIESAKEVIEQSIPEGIVDLDRRLEANSEEESHELNNEESGGKGGFYFDPADARVPGVEIIGGGEGNGSIRILDIHNESLGADLALIDASLDTAERTLTEDGYINLSRERGINWIEVKTSLADSKSFTLTRNEYERAIKETENYHIVRICEATKESAHIDRILSNISRLESENDIEVEETRLKVSYK